MGQLSKSTILEGLQCPRRIWLACNHPQRASEPDPTREAILEVGNALGREARRLFPGGVLVDESPAEHQAAVARTQELLFDPAVPALFEAAFGHEGVRIRTDVLERLPSGNFGLREVKASLRRSERHLSDLAIQCFVLEGCGIALESVELVRVNPDYRRDKDEIDWSRLLVREDCRRAIDARRRAMPTTVEALWACVSEADEPEVEPGHHCQKPSRCRFWSWCTREKPEDWIFHLPRIGPSRLEALRAEGIERISEIPEDFAISPTQRRARDAVRKQGASVSSTLAESIASFGPPTAYLDFETMNPIVPVYPGTQPCELIPFQWSLHRLERDGTLSHRAYLADAGEDPRREFAEGLIEALAVDDVPILVYSSFEAGCLGALRRRFPDLALALCGIGARLIDLLPVVRRAIYHPAFAGSFSIKRVAPALVPGFGWDAADGITEGGAASLAFARIASGSVAPREAAALRRQLLDYCARDTEALVVVHRALSELAA